MSEWTLWEWIALVVLGLMFGYGIWYISFRRK
jgi:hypothetical protein